MDAAMVTAIAALIGGPVAALGAMYGNRGANRAAREASAVTGFDSLTQRLVAERDKAEADQAKAEARVEVLELENARLRLMVERLGGTP
ncbi:hypothetical protein [Streptomyces viridochromogenes]|uniref:hypothetical protein n=1 Tax=Streptomyces viridochromogenes TaxID=1938 RepID=UPI00069DBFC8|nr:hypothetical protein [Streptomyces viridochromogenes]KOG21818.1 hypothetical protein ADK36_12655 [Streptomyces viridochromogenes]